MKNDLSFEEALTEVNKRQLACVLVLDGTAVRPGTGPFIMETWFSIRFRDRGKGNYFFIRFLWGEEKWGMVCFPTQALAEARDMAGQYGLMIEDIVSETALVDGRQLKMPVQGTGVYLLNGPLNNPRVKDPSMESKLMDDITQRLVAYT